MKSAFVLCCALSIFPYFTYAQKPPIQHAVNAQELVDIEKYWVSEKLDGIRGYWNGKQLFTRNGHAIVTPTHFTKHWPNIPMDGELWSKRQDFEKILSCVKRQTIRDNCWHTITFMIFDLPSHKGTFTERISKMESITTHANSKSLKMITQQRFNSQQTLAQHLATIEALGGEGLMLHHESALYQASRNKQLLKLKTFHDAEAVVIQHFKGKGKYQNVLGSILVKNDEGITFKIGSGFSDAQRKVPPTIGATITYKYIGKTKRGVPRFASFLRIRND